MEQVDNRIASGLPGKVRRGSAVCAFLVLLLTFCPPPGLRPIFQIVITSVVFSSRACA